LHGAYVAQADGVLEAYCDAVFPAVWVDAVNVDDREAMRAVLDAGGLEGAGILARVDDPLHDEALMATTREAAERGAFGAPTFFVADQMHFGQDRLDFVEAALRG
jgi:2-hydroxychromene-2-carboxylate isomerase